MNRYLHLFVGSFICLLASNIQAKTPGWTKQLCHSWRITKIDIPGEKAPDGLDYRIQFFKDNHFAADVEKGFVMDSFYTFENGKNRFLVVSAIVFHIDKLSGGTMELSVGVPFIQRIPTVHISLEAATEPVTLNREHLLDNWRAGTDYPYYNYEDLLRQKGMPFVISLGNNGKFSLYSDTILSSGKWEVDNNIVTLTYANGKKDQYAVKLLAEQMMSLSKIGTGEIVSLSHSYDSPEEMVWKKKKGGGQDNYGGYDYDRTMTDSVALVDTAMMEYDSTMAIETMPAPVEETYIEDMRPAEEFLVDTFVATGLLPFDADVMLPLKKVTLTFNKDSTYTLVYNGKTEKGRFKFYLNRSAITLQNGTASPRYCPIYIAWDYTGGRRNGVKSITITMGLPGEKEIKRVVME